MNYASGRASPERDALYGRLWRRLRNAYLRRNPLCRYCRELGKLTPASVVDHITPHKGDRALFFDQSNWQPLCTPCHDSVKQREERTGQRIGAHPDGTPLDLSHHWHTGERRG